MYQFKDEWYDTLDAYPVDADINALKTALILRAFKVCPEGIAFNLEDIDPLVADNVGKIEANRVLSFFAMLPYPIFDAISGDAIVREISARKYIILELKDIDPDHLRKWNEYYQFLVDKKKREADLLEDVRRKKHNKILIIESDDNSLEVLKTQLESLDFSNLIICREGTKGWDLIREHKDFELVIASMNSPVLSGLHILQRIRKSPPPIDKTKVILSTKVADRKVVQFAAAYKIQSILIKPYTIDTLNTHIQQALG